MIGRRLARFLFDRRPPAHALPPTGGSVLLVRWDGKLGDAVVSSFVYRELRKSGRWLVQVATTSDLADLHADVFGADRVLTTPVRPGWWALFQLWWRLGHVDVVVHMGGRLPPREMFFLWLLRPVQIHGMDSGLKRVGAGLSDATQGRSIQERYAEALRRMGLRAVDTSPFLRPAASADQGVAYVAFNPYASRHDKSIGAPKAADTLSHLAEALPDTQFRIISSPTTHADALELANAVAHDNVQVLDGVSTVRDVITAVDRADAVISVDTSIVHIAVALEKPLVAIFPSLDGAYDPWLPATSATVSTVHVPQDVASYRRTGRKHMDAFDEIEVCDRLVHVLAAATSRAAPLILPARIVPGLGVASRNLRLQLPLIAKRFPEVADCYPGTINVRFEQALTVEHPDHRSPALAWVPGRLVREVFEFVRVELELEGHPAAIPAWLYVAQDSPHRATPYIHEVIAARQDLQGVTACRIRIAPGAVRQGR